MDIQRYSKTEEGLALIERNVPFCVNNQLWQGWKKTPIKVHEDQLSDDEMLAVVDVDGTLKNVWATRKRRFEERVQRKHGEYMQRLTELRRQRNEIVTSMKADKEMGIPANPSDLAQIQEIDRRMKRLTEFAQVKQLAVATEALEPSEAIAVEEVKCDFCDKPCPEGHKSPEKWKRGHQMGCKQRN